MGAAGRMLRTGVIGTGRLGREHARVYAELGGAGSLCVYDRDAARAAEVAKRHGARVCESVASLLSSCDAVSVCTPATDHRDTVLAAFDAGVHVLVEKPIASCAPDAREMVAGAAARGRVLQVGHIERWNGAFEAARALLKRPRFIEAHRLATFTPRGLDVSVVQDLMIHDIDLILSVLDGKRLVDLRASGAGVLTSAADIVNARLEFDGGCVANITASRISREPLRKIRFFEENLYVSIDLREKSVEAFEKIAATAPPGEALDPAGLIRAIRVNVDRSEPLRKEISSFLDAVRGNASSGVTGAAGLAAIEVAERVLESVAKTGA